jgi:parallel beta-helix repeat protein
MRVVFTILILFGLLMAGSAGVSFGTVTTKQTITSSGSIVGDSPNYLIFQNSTANYLQNKQGQIIMSSSDPTAVINSAIADATSGNTILIDAGTYVLSNCIGSVGGLHQLTSSATSVTLTLASGAIIRAPANFQRAIMDLEGLTGWTIQGGEIDGNAANQPYSPSTTSPYGIGTGISLVYCTNCTVQNMYIHDARIYGVLLTLTCTGCKVLNNHVTEVGANGIEVGDSWSAGAGGPWNGITTNCLVQGNLIEHCSDVGLDIQGADNQILNNTVQNEGSSNSWTGMVNTYWGIGLECGDGYGVETTYGNLIENNLVTNCGFSIEQGLGMIGFASHEQILSNIVTDSSIIGIGFQSGNYNTISGNTVTSAPTCIGISYAGGGGKASYNTISNNNLSAANTGIYLDTDSSYNTGSGNSYTSVTTHVSNLGTGNSVS